MAKVRYTEYQSAAFALQREWCFSASTLRWEEQELSAGWFSASILHKRGHFSPRRMTYEGTAAASFPFYCEEWWLKFLRV